MGGITRTYGIITPADVWTYATRKLTETGTMTERALLAGASEILPAGYWIIQTESPGGAVGTSVLEWYDSVSAAWIPINPAAAANNYIYSDGTNIRVRESSGVNPTRYRRTAVDV